MELEQNIAAFYEGIKEDVRISPRHITIFLALLIAWQKQNYKNPIIVFSSEIMQIAKISGRATYHKSIEELHEYGYIKYEPSYNRFMGSAVYVGRGKQI